MACGDTGRDERTSGRPRSSRREAAVLVDPYDVDAIADGIAEARRRRDELRVAGLERASQFTWDETARLTLDVYREAAA